MPATIPDPQRGQFWSTPKGRTVEILARDEVAARYPDVEVDAVAYRFLGGATIHLRAVSSLRDWRQVEFE